MVIFFSKKKKKKKKGYLNYMDRKYIASTWSLLVRNFLSLFGQMTQNLFIYTLKKTHLCKKQYS